MPVSLDIKNKKILLIGGGKVCLEKITSLKQFTNNITIVSKEFDKIIEETPYQKITKSYDKPDLDGFFLVYACTNNHETNRQIKNDCREKGILVNVVDNPGECDFISPAIYKKGYMTVAVNSNGTDVRKSIAWRNKIAAFLEDENNDSKNH